MSTWHNINSNKRYVHSHMYFSALHTWYANLNYFKFVKMSSSYLSEHHQWACVRISLEYSKKGTPNPPHHPSPLQPQHHLCSPYLAGANDKPMGESTPRSPHTQACTRQLGKKEAERRGRPAHLTHNRASSWVGLKTAPPRLPAGSQEKKDGDHDQL